MSVVKFNRRERKSKSKSKSKSEPLVPDPVTEEKENPTVTIDISDIEVPKPRQRNNIDDTQEWMTNNSMAKIKANGLFTAGQVKIIKEHLTNGKKLEGKFPISKQDYNRFKKLFPVT